MKPVLKIFGWAYLILSLVGGFTLLANSSYYSYRTLETIVNYAALAAGIFSVLQGIIINVICYGIAEAINKSDKILNILNPPKPKEKRINVNDIQLSK